MCSKKWYLKSNISCDADLLNELLETDVPWDDAIVVSVGKLRKLRDSLSELRSSVCERRLERTVLRPALLTLKIAQFTQFFPSGMTSHSKIAQFNWKCTGRLIPGHTALNRSWHLTRRWKNCVDNEGELMEIQSEHKIFPWLQTVTTRKLRGIQFFFLPLLKLVSKILYELSYISEKKNICLYSK